MDGKTTAQSFWGRTHGSGCDKFLSRTMLFDGQPNFVDIFAAARGLHDEALAAQMPIQVPVEVFPATTSLFPYLTCAVWTGDPALHLGEQQMTAQLVQAPEAGTGWRSQADLMVNGVKCLSLELITSFLSTEEEDLTALQGGLEAGPNFALHRSNALRAIGEADRSLAFSNRHLEADRHLVSDEVFASCKVVDLVSLSPILDQNERKCLPPDGSIWSPKARRMHAFAPVAKAGRMELVSRLERGPSGTFATSLVRSHLRECLNQTPLAVCETLFRMRSRLRPTSSS